MAGSLIVPGGSPTPSQPLHPEYGGETGAGDGGEQGLDFERYLTAIKRFKWLIVGLIVVGIAGGVFAAGKSGVTYTSTATLWVESARAQGGRPVIAGPIQSEGLLDAFGWQQLLLSYRVLDTVVVEHRLNIQAPTDPPALFGTLKLGASYAAGEYVLAVAKDGSTVSLLRGDGSVVQTARPGEPLGKSVGLEWVPGVTPSEFDSKTPFSLVSVRTASDQLRARITANLTDASGNFLRVELTGRRASSTTAQLNSIIEHFVLLAGELKSYKTSDQKQVLTEQLDLAKTRLAKAEGDLEAYRSKNATLPSEAISLSQGGVVSRYFSDKVQADELREQRETLERLSRDPAFAPDAFLQVPAVRTAPDLQRALTELSEAESQRRALLAKYTDAATPVRDIDARIGALRQRTIPAYASELGRALEGREREITSKLGLASRELQQIPSRAINEQRLAREAAQAASIFQDVQSRYSALTLAEASQQSDVRVLDAASLPTLPSTNTGVRVLFLSVLMSIGGSLGLAILLDRLDKRFRYPKQVTSELGLGILGVIPPLSRNKADLEAASQALEAFRSVRLALTHAHGSAGPIAFTITSPSPGDGKSLISANLALAFAETGASTLLIDGDIRRGELHRLFERRRQPGLLDVLAGQAALDAALATTSHVNLTVLPCGTRLQRGPEMLGSPAMRELYGTLRSRFQVIIIDSPPLGAGIDPFVLGTVTGGMVLVLRAGETDRHLAEAKLKLIDRLPVRMLGAILNDVRTGEGSYKYYSYVYGYSAEEEGEAVMQLPPSAGGSAS